MIRLEKRPLPSQFWQVATPIVAVIMTMFAGGLMFATLGKNPIEVIRTIFWDPLFGEFAWYLRGQLMVKAGPLILIAIGLSLGFRAGIWNIGAEGQYIMGAICGAAVGLSAETLAKVKETLRGQSREAAEAGLRSLYAPPLATAQQDWRVLQPAAQAAPERGSAGGGAET